jgi:hypothetical protein
LIIEDTQVCAQYILHCNCGYVTKLSSAWNCSQTESTRICKRSGPYHCNVYTQSYYRPFHCSPTKYRPSTSDLSKISEINITNTWLNTKRECYYLRSDLYWYRKLL